MKGLYLQVPGGLGDEVAAGLAGAFRSLGQDVLAVLWEDQAGAKQGGWQLVIRALGANALVCDSWVSGGTVQQCLQWLAQQAKSGDLVLIVSEQHGSDPTKSQQQICSAAALATQLGAPCLLVLDASSGTVSVTDVLHSLKHHIDQHPKLATPLALLHQSNTSSATFTMASLAAAMRAAGLATTQVLGSTPQLRLQGSSLTIGEQAELLGAAYSHALDLTRLQAAAAPLTLPTPATTLPPAPPPAATAGLVIAVAMDDAFQPTYAGSLGALRAAGATVVPFSPVHDRALPPGCSGVLLPGTATSLTPHVLAQLTVNAPMRAALAAFCAAGGPVLTESAGLVYLCQKAAVQEGGQEGGLEQGLVRSAPSVPLVAALPFKAVLDSSAAASHSSAGIHVLARLQPETRKALHLPPNAAAVKSGYQEGHQLRALYQWPGIELLEETRLNQGPGQTSSSPQAPPYSAAFSAVERSAAEAGASAVSSPPQTQQRRASKEPPQTAAPQSWETGYCRGSVIASALHWDLAAAPQLLHGWLAACAAAGTSPSAAAAAAASAVAGVSAQGHSQGLGYGSNGNAAAADDCISISSKVVESTGAVVAPQHPPSRTSTDVPPIILWPPGTTGTAPQQQYPSPQKGHITGSKSLDRQASSSSLCKAGNSTGAAGSTAGAGAGVQGGAAPSENVRRRLALSGRSSIDDLYSLGQSAVQGRGLPRGPSSQGLSAVPQYPQGPPVYCGYGAVQQPPLQPQGADGNGVPGPYYNLPPNKRASQPQLPGLCEEYDPAKLQGTLSSLSLGGYGACTALGTAQISDASSTAGYTDQGGEAPLHWLPPSAWRYHPATGVPAILHGRTHHKHTGLIAVPLRPSSGSGKQQEGVNSTECSPAKMGAQQQPAASGHSRAASRSSSCTSLAAGAATAGQQQQQQGVPPLQLVSNGGGASWAPPPLQEGQSEKEVETPRSCASTATTSLASAAFGWGPDGAWVQSTSHFSAGNSTGAGAGGVAHMGGLILSNNPGGATASTATSAPLSWAHQQSQVTTGSAGHGPQVSSQQQQLLHLPPHYQHHHTGHQDAGGDAIISMCPGATEILAAMGLAGRLVGVSDRCDFPPGIQDDKLLVCRGGGCATAVASTSASTQQHQNNKQGGYLSLPSSLQGGGGGSHHQQTVADLWSLREPLLVDEDVLRDYAPRLVVLPALASLPRADQLVLQKALQRTGLSGGAAAMPGDMAHGPAIVMQHAVLTLADMIEAVLQLGDAACAPHAAGVLADRLRARLRRVAALAATGGAANASGRGARHSTSSGAPSAITYGGASTGSLSGATVAAAVAAAAIYRHHSLPGAWAGGSSLGSAGGSAGAGLIEGPLSSGPPRVLVLSSLKPLVKAGRWVPEMLSLAGALEASSDNHHRFSATSSHHAQYQSGYGSVNSSRPYGSTGSCGVPLAQQALEPAQLDTVLSGGWSELKSLAPDILVVATTHAEALAALPELAGAPGWWALPAVRAGAVYLVEPAYFTRPGPRLVDGVELLAAILGHHQPDTHPTAPSSAAALSLHHPRPTLQDCATGPPGVVPLGQAGSTAQADASSSTGGSAPSLLPRGAVLKLSLSNGQRCRPRLLPNYFVPWP